MKVRTAEGETRVWEYYNTLRTQGVQSPIVRGMAHDVTERRQALKREKEARLEAKPPTVSRMSFFQLFLMSCGRH